VVALARAAGVGVRDVLGLVAVGCASAVAVALAGVLGLPTAHLPSELLDLELVERLKEMAHEASLGARLVSGGDSEVDLHPGARQLSLECEGVEEIAREPGCGVDDDGVKAAGVAVARLRAGLGSACLARSAVDLKFCRGQADRLPALFRPLAGGAAVLLRGGQGGCPGLVLEGGGHRASSPARCARPSAPDSSREGGRPAPYDDWHEPHKAAMSKAPPAPRRPEPQVPLQSITSGPSEYTRRPGMAALHPQLGSVPIDDHCQATSAGHGGATAKRRCRQRPVHATPRPGPTGLMPGVDATERRRCRASMSSSRVRVLRSADLLPLSAEFADYLEIQARFGAASADKFRQLVACVWHRSSAIWSAGKRPGSSEGRVSDGRSKSWLTGIVWSVAKPVGSVRDILDAAELTGGWCC
jgi:hypothetical protein